MIIDGIYFEEYIIKSVTMDLETCFITFNVIFHKDKKRVVRIKEFTYKTNCDVNVNEQIKKLEQEIHGTNILS